MQSDNEANCRPAHDAAGLPEVAVLSAREAVRRDLKDLEVSAGATVALSPYEPEFADYFVRVEVKKFDDLQVLGLVPRGLAEDKVRRAIADDDAEAYRTAHAMLANPSAGGGGCECAQERASGAGRGDLRQHYERARRRFNPALSRVLSEHMRTQVDWDSPVVGAVRKWTLGVSGGRGGYYASDAVPSFTLTVLHIFLRDVIINRGATLQVESAVRNFLARYILIHRTGRLVHGGGYLKIWASHIAPLSNLTLSLSPTDRVAWALANA